MSISAIPLVSKAKRNAPESRTIVKMLRDEILATLEDDALCEEVFNIVSDPGKAGNRQMDQALAADLVMRANPTVAGYKWLNHKSLWGHMVVVLRQLGYEFSQGHVTGYAIEYQREDEAA